MSDKIQAVLLAGGRGTRLAPLTDHLPKPLVPIRGKAIILYVLEHLKNAGITNVAITVAYLGEQIESFLGDGSRFGMRITYLYEPTPMGTGGWAKLIDWSKVEDAFLVINADNLFWINLEAFFLRHKEVGGIATIAAIELPSQDILNYEILQPNTEGERLQAWIDRTQTAQVLAGKTTGFVNSGWYIMTPSVRSFIEDTLPYSNETHLWPRLAQSGQPIGFYHGKEPWFDSGTHERLAKIEAFLATRSL